MVVGREIEILALLTLVERIAQRNIENEHRTRFNQAWSATVIRATSECFHNNFRVKFQARPLCYRGFGLRITFTQQKKFARQQRMARMQLVGHVPTKLQDFS